MSDKDNEKPGSGDFSENPDSGKDSTFISERPSGGEGPAPQQKTPPKPER